MRKVKVSMPYYKYLGEKLNNKKISLHEQIRISYLYPTPGNIYHNHPRKERVFTRHVAQGNKVNMLYWRLHKNEYNQFKTAI